MDDFCRHCYLCLARRFLKSTDYVNNYRIVWPFFHKCLCVFIAWNSNLYKYHIVVNGEHLGIRIAFILNNPWVSTSCPMGLKSCHTSARNWGMAECAEMHANLFIRAADRDGRPLNLLGFRLKRFKKMPDIRLTLFLWAPSKETLPGKYCHR